jgi:hypothetical protein
MSEFNFGTGHGEVSTRERQRIEKICKQFSRREVTFTVAKIAGDGPRYWFSATNLGHPFDEQIENEVLAAVGEIKTKQPA